jgi:hypothetical protein
MQALGAGKSASDVPEWKYRRSNISAARAHFYLAAARETTVLSNTLPSSMDEHILSWLKKAEALSTAIYAIGSLHARTELKHQPGWRKAYETFVSNRDA